MSCPSFAKITIQLLIKGGFCALLIISTAVLAEPPFFYEDPSTNSNAIPIWRGTTVEDQEQQLLDYQQKKHGRIYVPVGNPLTTLKLSLRWPGFVERGERVILLKDDHCQKISLCTDPEEILQLCWQSQQLLISAVLRQKKRMIHLHRRILSHPYWRDGQLYRNIGAAEFSGLSLTVQYANATK